MISATSATPSMAPFPGTSLTWSKNIQLCSQEPAETGESVACCWARSARSGCASVIFKSLCKRMWLPSARACVIFCERTLCISKGRKCGMCYCCCYPCAVNSVALSHMLNKHTATTQIKLAQSSCYLDSGHFLKLNDFFPVLLWGGRVF